MTTSEREYCEKTTLLNKCGETLFGCSGELLITQGIYVPRSLSPSSTHCLCRRTVWVPDSLSHEYLLQHLDFFCAPLPFSVQMVASLHRFGLCGVNPTRTAHAIDKHFFLLAKFPHRHFAVYGIVEFRKVQTQRISVIVNISTTKEDVMNYVKWIKSEFTLHLLSKRTKNKRTSHGVHSDYEAQVFEGQKLAFMQVTDQDLIQHKSTETESDVSAGTPESTNPQLSHSVNMPIPCFNGSILQGPNTSWVPCMALQSTSEAIGCPNLSLIPSFPSLFKSVMSCLP